MQSGREMSFFWSQQVGKVDLSVKTTLLQSCVVQPRWHSTNWSCLSLLAVPRRSFCAAVLLFSTAWYKWRFTVVFEAFSPRLSLMSWTEAWHLSATAATMARSSAWLVAQRCGFLGASFMRWLLSLAWTILLTILSGLSNNLEIAYWLYFPSHS